MEDQPDKIGKLALCVSSCTLAKDEMVLQEGIGEDLPFTVFGWSDSTLIIVAQLDQSLMKTDPEDRLQRVSFCASLFRMGWGVDAITFVAEAFCSTNPDETRNQPLDLLFANGHESVSECLTFTHIDGNEPSLVMLPYKVGIGRKVEWGEAVHQREASGLRDAAYPAAIQESLALDVHDRPPDVDKYFDFLIYGLSSKGFNVDFLNDI